MRSGLGYRVLGSRRNAFVIFQGFVGQVDGLFQLGVVAADDQVWALLYFVVAVYTVVLDDPFASVVRGPEGKFRRGHIAAVAQGNAAGYADEAAPSTRADDGADFFAMEKPGERVTARAGEFIDDHYLGTVDGDGGPADVGSFARCQNGEELALEFFRIEVGDLTAGIGALIDDDAVFIELADELFVEGDDAGNGSVWHVHVADATMSGLRDFAAIGVDPIEVMRPVVASGGFYGYVPRAFRGRLGIDFERDDLSRDVLKIGVDVEIGAGFAAIDGD